MKKLSAALCALSILWAMLLTLPACKKAEGDGDPAALSEDASTLETETSAAGETTSNPADETTAGQTAAESSSASGQQSPAATTAAQTPAATESAQSSTAAQTPAATEGAQSSTAAQTSSSAAAQTGNALALTLSASRADGLRVGDTFDVTIGIKNAKWLASVTLNLNYDPEVFSVAETERASVSGFDALIKDYGNYVKYAGYTMNTVDIAENDLVRITFRVRSVPAENSALLDVTVLQLDLGTDASGSATRPVKNEVAAPSLRLGFAG